MQNQLTFRLFGSPKFTYQDRPVTGFVSNKARALLIYLAVTRRPHSRDALAELLWADTPTSQRANLRKALSNLRNLAGVTLLEEEPQFTALDLTHYGVDVIEFEQLARDAARTADVAALQRAVQLYQGDFLAGFPISVSYEFEAWALGEQTRLRAQMVEALRQLTDAYAQRAEFPQAIATIRRLLQLEPWREEAHCQLMALLARSGDRAAALRQFEQCRQILATELNVEPGPFTIELEASIRAGTFDAAHDQPPPTVAWPTTNHVVAAPRHNLPAPTTPLIGREQELSELAQLLADPDIRLVTILGAGGMGKTRLALAAAEHQGAQFENGPYWVSLASFTEPGSTILAIGEAIDFAFQEGQPLLAQLCTYLHDKQILLLLDNFEHLIVDSPLLTEILQGAPKVKLLVTSRERLNLQGEWSLNLGGLVIPPHDTIEGEVLEQYSATALFWQRACQVQSTLSIRQAETKAIVHICQLVQGMPLAIELAAALTRVFSCADIAQEIEKSLDILTTTMRDVPSRHRSLQAVFAHSWQLLSQTEQRIFAQLSIFRGDFTRDAALQVADASWLLLSALIDKSLIRQNLTQTYAIHGLVRQFAAEKLHSSGQFELLQERYEAYFTAQSAKELRKLTKGRIFHQNNFRNVGAQKQYPPITNQPAGIPQQQARRVLMISPEYLPYFTGGVSKHVAELLLALGEITLDGKVLLIDLITPCFAHETPLESISPTITVYRVNLPEQNTAPDESGMANKALIQRANSLFQQYKYDLLHIHESVAGALGIRLKEQWQLPMLATIHATIQGRTRHTGSNEFSELEQIERRLCNEAERVIVTSQFMRQEVHKYLGIPFDKMSVVPNGIPVRTEAHHPSDELNALRQQYAPAGQKLLFFVGPTVYEKGLLTLIRAMPRILAQHPDVCLLVASRHGIKLQPLAQALNVDKSINFLGFISDDLRDSLYQSVDAVIIPSLYEPFGLVALEAMALGCTVIASNVGGLGEVVKHRHNGLLISPDDTDSIVQAVHELFADPLAAQQWRENALKDVETLYQWDKIATQTAKIYESIIEKQP